MELENRISKVTEIVKKPLRIALVSAIAAYGAYGCAGGDYPNKGLVVSKWHEDERRSDGTILESYIECDPLPIGVPIGGGLHCRNAFRYLPATVIYKEDWVIQVNSCKGAEKKDCREINLYTDESTFLSVSEGDNVDLTKSNKISRERPTTTVKK